MPTVTRRILEKHDQVVPGVGMICVERRIILSAEHYIAVGKQHEPRGVGIGDIVGRIIGPVKYASVELKIPAWTAEKLLVQFVGSWFQVPF